MADDITRRVTLAAWPGKQHELRFLPGGDGRSFSGYAAVFDQTSADLGGFREIIAPGAFARSLADPQRDVRMFWNHDQGRLLASTEAGTLQLREDDHGLLVEARLSDTTDGRDMATLIREGNVRSMSFGFSVAPADIAWDAKHTTRTVRRADLFEVSPVTGWPAYGGTSASVRSDLRDAGTWAYTPDEVAGSLGFLLAHDLLDARQRTILRRALERGPRPRRSN